MKAVTTIFTLLIAMLMTAQPQPQPTIEVSGEGTVSVVPDRVTISVSVQNEGQDPKTLKQQNDATVSEVLQFLKGQNIPSKNITTQFVQLNKNYDYNTKKYKYSASQTISVLLEDMSKYEKVMTGLVNSGVNRIGGISFGTSKKDELEAEARRLAILDAKQKATEYVKPLGQSVGKAVLISEFQQSSNGPGPMYKMAMMDSSGGGEQETLAPGEMEVKAKVNVSFILN